MQKKNHEATQLILNLNKKIKKFDCLYKIDDVLKDFNNNLDDIFNNIIEIIPKGWRYPEICKVKINYCDKEYCNKDIKITDLKQTEYIKLEDNIVGEINVFYIKPLRKEKGIFIEDEHILLKTIADKLSSYLSYRDLKEQFKKKDAKNNDTKTQDIEFISWLKNLHLTDENIEKFSKVKIKFKKGETICKQGSFSSFIMILKNGLVKASIESQFDKSYIFKITKPFNFIGLSTMYGDEYYNFSANALVPSTLYLVDKKVFNNTITENPKFANEIIKMQCESSKHIYSRLGCISNKQALGRVCETLIYLSNNVLNSPVIGSSISRKDIAELSSMSTENTVRILSELKKDKIIKIESKSIEIINSKLLLKLSNAG